MKKITYLDAKDFSQGLVASQKGDRKLFVVFSTRGEREAGLIYDKICLLHSSLGDLVDGILLSHRRCGDSRESTEVRAREACGEVDILVCNSFEVPGMGLEGGKGADMRRCLYHINKNRLEGSDPKKAAVVFLDADVLPRYFGPSFVLGLAGAVFSGFDFAKAGFWRAMGRIKKFVAQPLNSLISHPDLDPIRDLSYPLAGEVAGTCEFFNAMPFCQGYGIETVINIEACFSDFSIADVNLGLYDHDHRPDFDIQKMAFGIMRSYLMQLIEHGLVELKCGAVLSERFQASFVDEEGERGRIDFDLVEKKYPPLKNIL